MADLLNLFNAAASFSNVITSDIIRKQEENAALQVKTTMQDYAIKQQEFLQKLQSDPSTSRDFENWGKYATDFQEEYKKSILNSKVNPVNNLTAKYLNESLDAQYTSLLLKVKDQAFNNINESYMAESMKAVDQIRTLKTGQNAYNEESTVYDDLYSRGQLTDAQYYDKKASALRYHTYENMEESVKGIAENAIASGMSIDQCLSEARKNIENYTPIEKTRDSDPLLTKDENNKIKSEILDQVKINYNSSLKKLQENNEAYLSTYLDKILQDDANKSIYKKQGMNALNALLKNNKNSLSIEQKIKYERYFKPDEEEISGGSGSSAKSINFDTQIKDTANSLIAAVKNGEYNSNVQGLSSGHEVMAYFNSTLTEILNSSNISEIEKQKKFNLYSRYFMEQLKSAYKKDCPFVGEMIDKLNTKIDQWNKNGKYNSKEMTNQSIEFLLDQVADLDPSNKAQMEQALKNTESYMQALYSNDVADWMKGKDESDKFINKWTNKDGTLKPESLAAGMYDLQLVKEKKKNPNAKVIYSNFYGESDISQSATDAINKVIDPGAKQAISMITGGTAENIRGAWESEGLDKETGNRIYQDEKGNLYKIVSTGKKSYDIMKKEGKDFVKIGNSKDVEKKLNSPDEQKKLNKEAKAKAKATKKERFKNLDNLEENQRLYVAEKTREIAEKTDKSPFPQISDAEWQNMTIDDRAIELQRDNDIVSNILESY